MTTAERNRNLAKARTVRRKRLDQDRRRLAREHARADRVYRAAVATYYRVRRTHGEGSAQERENFRRMIRAEAEWFRTYPRVSS